MGLSGLAPTSKTCSFTTDYKGLFEIPCGCSDLLGGSQVEVETTLLAVNLIAAAFSHSDKLASRAVVRS